MRYINSHYIIQFEKQKQYVGMGITWYFVDNACCLSLNDVQFFKMGFCGRREDGGARSILDEI